MKNILMIFIVAFGFNNHIKAQSKNISFKEIKYNVNTVSKSFAETKESPYDYIAITIDDYGNRWFYLSWGSLDGLRGSEQKASIEVAVMFFDAVYKNYNYTKEYPIGKIRFINALINKKITGIKTSTKNNVFSIEWQELIDKGYL